jgi:hypothetical protein
MNKDVADLLAAEAEEAERHADEEDHGPSRRRQHPPRDPAQVYSLRVPVAQLEQLRELAAERRVSPSALMRQWVLERLAAEAAGLPDAMQVWQRLSGVLADLEDAHRRLAESVRLQRGSAPGPAGPGLSLDPVDEEQAEIRELITDRVVERMHEEIAEWRQERVSAGDN